MTTTAKKAAPRKAEGRGTIDIEAPLVTSDLIDPYTPPVHPPGEPLTTHEVDPLDTEPPPEVEDVISTHELEPLETEGKG